MQGRIYLLHEAGESPSLQAINEQAYAREDLLQSLLAQYPDLLAGEQMDQVEPRRWLLVSREVGVPGEEDGPARWSLDHLFLDQDGVPTLVEVKRSSDHRIRREVVGQLLDYAANAVVYWPVESIRSVFEIGCESRADNPVQLVAELVGEASSDTQITEQAVEKFWELVKTNLKAGRIRLVFVADEIPVELKRIVEFLNEQMDPAEVLAVEVKQYVGQGVRALVPRVIGQTAQALQSKASPGTSGRQWDEASLLDDLARKKGLEQSEVAQQVIAWARGLRLKEQWGQGKQTGTFTPILLHAGARHKPFSVWSDGYILVNFQFHLPPTDGIAVKTGLLERLNRIPEVNIGPDAFSKLPPIWLPALFDPKSLSLFFEAFEWWIGEIRRGTT